ncbi:hypothetical protein [Shewanella cutis]|uniref:Uncharacterized protein n=1 Tax=Shewanella cutis TaxID=2766780 RepID=A0ABS9QV73_9GAMM|nr:hypothetical protein [Shewanella sp. PS-2]MCG9964242.1 hypothetical protein [Shewanella sp. PS-2]
MYTRMLFNIVSSSLMIVATLPSTTFAADELTGVWLGQLGKSKIRVCFNQYGTGSYYYQKYLTPIRLELQDGIWKEENNTGNWQFDTTTPQKLSGHWFKDSASKSQPIQLERQISPDNNDDCSADAYNLPLETTPSLSRGKWQSYQTIEYRPLTFGTDIGIEFKGPQTGITSINQFLERKLTDKTQLSDTFETRRRMLAQMGSFVADETFAEPIFINQHWLSVRLYRWAAGYGANGISQEFVSFSLADGKPFHPWQWFIENEQPQALPESMSYPLPQALKQKLFADITPNAECPTSDGSGYYQLTLEANGIKFWETPRGDGCEQEFILTPQEAMPFATSWGKTQLKLLE